MPTKLNLSSGASLRDPRDDEIRAALAGLESDGFAILEFDEMTYCQVAGDAAAGFAMECQDGDVDKHYRAVREDFSLDEVVAALCAYRDGHVNWDDYGQWEQITW